MRDRWINLKSTRDDGIHSREATCTLRASAPHIPRIHSCLCIALKLQLKGNQFVHLRLLIRSPCVLESSTVDWLGVGVAQSPTRGNMASFKLDQLTLRLQEAILQFELCLKPLLQLGG